MKFCVEYHKGMLLRLFLLSILLFFTPSFLCGGEEKDLLLLHRKGESALQSKDYRGAIESFEEFILRQKNKRLVEWQLLVDTYLQLAKCYEKTNDEEGAERTFSRLLDKKPPSFFLPKIKLSQIRVKANQERAEEAYCTIKNLSTQLPDMYWSKGEKTFLHALESSLNNIYDEYVSKAKLFQRAELYSEAISLYQKVLLGISQGCYPKASGEYSVLTKRIRYNLAETQFLAKESETGCPILCDATEEPLSCDPELFLLLTQYYREKKEYEESLILFQDSLPLISKEEIEQYNKALLEMGMRYYRLKNHGEAARYFSLIVLTDKSESLLATLYLAKIKIQEKHPQEARNLLTRACPFLRTNKKFQNEYCYMQGLTEYALGNFDQAADFFEQCISKIKPASKKEAFYHLAWCHIKKNQLKSLFKAEKILIQLLDTPLHESASLSLYELYRTLALNFHLETRHREEALNPSFVKLSFEGQIKALLLMAEAKVTFKEREEVYARAVSNIYENTSSYPQAWFSKGMNALHWGMANHDHSLFPQAIDAFHHAFSHVDLNHKKIHSSIIPYHSRALLKQLFVQYDTEINLHEETLYLRGLLASHLDSPYFLTLAETSLLRVVELFPQGSYHVDALYALASLYYKVANFGAAKKIFSSIIDKYPQSNYSPLAHFWAAESAAYLTQAGTHYYQDIDCSSRELSCDHPFLYFHYSALLKKAKNLIEEGENLENCRKGVNALHELLQELSLPDRSPLVEPLWQECALTLVAYYSKHEQNLNAQKMMVHMLRHFDQRGIKQSIHLGQIWQELGKLAVKCENYTSALHCFQFAGIHGKKIESRLNYL